MMREVTSPRKVGTWWAAAQLCIKEKYTSRGLYWLCHKDSTMGIGNVQTDMKTFILCYSFLVGSFRNASVKSD